MRSSCCNSHRLIEQHNFANKKQTNKRNFSTKSIFTFHFGINWKDQSCSLKKILFSSVIQPNRQCCQQCPEIYQKSTKKWNLFDIWQQKIFSFVFNFNSICYSQTSAREKGSRLSACRKSINETVELDFSLARCNRRCWRFLSHFFTRPRLKFSLGESSLHSLHICHVFYARLGCHSDNLIRTSDDHFKLFHFSLLTVLNSFSLWNFLRHKIKNFRSAFASLSHRVSTTTESVDLSAPASVSREKEEAEK